MNLSRRIILLVLILGTAPALAEFYKYVDESGIARYTDDLSQVPVNQRPGVNTYTESPSYMPNKKPLDINALKKLLENKKQDLDREYQELMMEEVRLEEEKNDIKTDQGRRKHNEKIRSFNEKSRKYLEKKDAYEKQAAVYKKRLRMETAGNGEPAGARDSAIEKPISMEKAEIPPTASEQGQEAPGDIDEIKTQLKNKKQELDQEYQALLEEQKKVAADKKNSKTYSDAMAYNAEITKFNEKLKKFEEKQKSFNQEVKSFTARLEQALNEKPEQIVSGKILKK